MQALTLLIAIVALLVAIAAFARTGGMKMLSREAQEAKNLAARATADALEKIEERLRQEQRGDRPRASQGPGDKEGEGTPPQPESKVQT